MGWIWLGIKIWGKDHLDVKKDVLDLLIPSRLKPYFKSPKSKEYYGLNIINEEGKSSCTQEKIVFSINLEVLFPSFDQVLIKAFQQVLLENWVSNVS